MLVIFDVDGTLIKGDSLLLAAKESVLFPKKIIYILKFLPIIILWKLKFISDESFKEKFLKNFKICDLFNRKEKIGEKLWFLDVLKRSLNREALARLNFHKERGDRIILCSASLDMILLPLADYLNVELICTTLEIKNGNWIPKIKGFNCKGNNKIEALKKYLINFRNLEYEAYGDSEGDKELLNNAKFPHYRNFSSKQKPYPNYSLKNLILVFGLILLSYGIISSFYQKEVLEVIKNLEITFFECLFFITSGYLIRFLRWRIIIKKLDLNIPWRDDFLAWMGSYSFTASPGKAGELMRSYFIYEKFGISIIKTTSSIIFERVSDFISVLCIVFFNWKIFITINSEWAALVANYLIFLVIFTSSFIFLSYKYKFNFKKFLNKFFPKNFSRFSNISLGTLKEFFNFNFLIITSFLGIISWSLEGLSLWLILNKISPTTITFGGATLAHTSAGMLGAISMLPGGIGTTEISLISLLSLQGINLDIAGISTVIIRLMTLWYATFLGFISLLIKRTYG